MSKCSRPKSTYFNLNVRQILTPVKNTGNQVDAITRPNKPLIMHGQGMEGTRTASDNTDTIFRTNPFI